MSMKEHITGFLNSLMRMWKHLIIRKLVLMVNYLQWGKFLSYCNNMYGIMGVVCIFTSLLGLKCDLICSDMCFVKTFT